MISGASDEELDIANARADLLSELQPEIDNLKKENQKYKEVIDKAIEYINLIVLGETLNGEPVLFKEEAEGQYLLSILREAE